MVRNRKERRNRRTSQDQAEASESEKERCRSTRSGVGGRKREEKVQNKEGHKVGGRVQEEGGEEKTKREAPPGGLIGEEGRGPLARSWPSAWVGKWVYKRGPGDSISTHDPTFIPIANSPSQTSIIARARKKEREDRERETGTRTSPAFFRSPIDRARSKFANW